MMRIVGGTHRGTRLVPVGAGDASAHLRPTSDRVREAIFNLLLNGRLDGGADRAADPVAGARVLDLFAGTGALGLEAMSRGAAEAVFVDDGKAAGALIEANIARLALGRRCTVVAADATRLPRNHRAPFALVFLDPPYGKALGEGALASALAGNWIAPGALLVWEEGRPPVPPAAFATVDVRRYGETSVTILRAPERVAAAPP